MRKIPLLMITIATSACTNTENTQAQTPTNPLIIEQQGSFAVGGTKFYEQGKFNLASPLKPEGQSFHGDHAYVFYQIPAKAHKYPLVFLHGAGQSKKTWETTPDGREGFQNIFLRRGYGVYLLDQPRRGDAGRSTVAETINPKVLKRSMYLLHSHNYLIHTANPHNKFASRRQYRNHNVDA